MLGEGATGDLLVLSQVVFSLQLCFAVIPLVHLVSDRRWLGPFRVGALGATAGWVTALIIALLNLELARQEIVGWVAPLGASLGSAGDRSAGHAGAGILLLYRRS